MLSLRSRFMFRVLGIAIVFAMLNAATRAQPAADPTKADPAKSDPTKAESPKPEELQAKLILAESIETPDAPKYTVVREGMDLFVKRDFDGARKKFETARLDNKELPPAEILMTRMLLAARSPQLARAELEQCVRTNETDPEPYLYFAEAAINEGRITDAAAVLAIASPKLAAYKDNNFRLNNLAKRYWNMSAAVAESRKQWDVAKVSLSKWIELDLKSSIPRQRLARALFQLNSKDPNVVKELEEAAKLEKAFPSPNVVMAQLFESLNDNAGREQAAKYVESALAEKVATDGSNKDRVLKSFVYATQAALAANKLNDAVRYAEGALKIDPRSLEAQLVRGVVARMARDYVTAERMLEAVIAQNPLNFPASNNLTLVLLEQPEKAKQERAVQLAMMNFSSNKENQQTNVEAAATLGWAYYKLGNMTEAGKMLEAVLKSNQVSPDSKYYVARFLADRGQNTNALAVVDEALQTPLFFNRVEAEALKKKLTTPDSGKEAPKK